jgi:hypothetical protein
MFRHFVIIREYISAPCWVTQVLRLQQCISYNNNNNNIIIMLKYCVVCKIKSNPFGVTIFHVISVCLWLQVQSLLDTVTVLLCCVKQLYFKNLCNLARSRMSIPWWWSHKMSKHVPLTIYYFQNKWNKLLCYGLTRLCIL